MINDLVSNDYNDDDTVVITEEPPSINSPFYEKIQKESHLTFRSVFSTISATGFPIALSFTFSAAVFITNTMLIHLSETDDEEAAVTLITILMNTVCTLGISPVLAVALYLRGKLAELNKAENVSEKEKLKKIISSVNANSLLVAAICTPSIFLPLFFSENLMVSIFRQDKNVSRNVQIFSRTFAFVSPALMARASFEQVMFAFGKEKAAMVIGLIDLVIGNFISLMLGFGKDLKIFTIPKLGAPGVALGFVVEGYLTALFYGLYIWRKQGIREYDIFKDMLNKILNGWNVLKEILKIGSSFFFVLTIEFAMTLAVGILSGKVGVTEQAAMSLNTNVMYFEFLFLAAFGVACSQAISEAIGAQRNNDINKLALYSLITVLIYLVPLPLAFAISPKALEIITGGASKEISNILKTLVPIMSTGFIIDLARYILLQQLRALKDLLIPTIIAFISMASGIGLAAYLGLATPLGINGVAIGYTTGVTTAALMLMIRWIYKIKPESVEQGFNPEVIKLSTPSKTSSYWNFFKRINIQQRDKEQTPLLEKQPTPTKMCCIV